MRAFLSFLLLIAQTAAPFDVVSIKPGAESANAPIRRMRLQNNRWTATRVTVREIIQEAHKAEGLDMPDRVVGGPPWLDQDRFDIVATSASPPSPDQLAGMLRALLADRFALSFHIEKKTLPSFELVLARRDGKPGPELRPTTTDCRPDCGVRIVYGPAIQMTSSGVEMRRFAFVLSAVLRQPVIDHTGLTGLFGLSLDFAPGTELTAPVASDAPSLFTAIEERLGLKLRSQRAPLDVLVVDRAEKPTFD
jgi:uncharacterized protein (TIGR03435 family)